MSDSEGLKVLAEGINDFLDGVEASCVKLRMQIQKLLGEVKGSTRLPFDASKIKWQKREGPKGEFELSEDYDNPDHKALLKFLNEHAGGCINSEGRFYWVFQDAKTVGRKKKVKS